MAETAFAYLAWAVFLFGATIIGITAFSVFAGFILMLLTYFIDDELVDRLD